MVEFVDCLCDTESTGQAQTRDPDFHPWERMAHTEEESDVGTLGEWSTNTFLKLNVLIQLKGSWAMRLA
jgi:hypothetical protein